MVDRVEIQSTIYILEFCYKTRAKIFCKRYSTENSTERLQLQSFAKCQSLERRGVAQIPERQRQRLIPFGGRVSLRGEKKRLGGNVHPQNGDIGGCEASCVASEDYTIDQVRTLGRPDHISCWVTSP